MAVQDIAERMDLPADHAEEMLRALEAQPCIKRELPRLRVAEVWLRD